jgi:hypothetical protein
MPKPLCLRISMRPMRSMRFGTERDIVLILFNALESRQDGPVS